ncbi:hypothetical protein U0C82_12130 [Fulvimarina sp. 2208YS6-2-32]|uniref:Uncharacterized protein n=1 Tax=Fulvimarina uroteuthidis TaxID=3098149 RepID=A0ABU5I465_9HYPH|nr:hypothetical protein [Fulvimarina sp. 2208YS6-2-32]MDY8109887.1 hypothetical protein [Fulvimarina sp. 2208YS6-2-32]
MSTLLTINIENDESTNQTFYVFQQPAIYDGGSQVYSNALWSGLLGGYQESGGTLTFQINMQFYAGIQQAHSTPQVGHSSGYASAIRAIDLETDGTTTNDSVTATLTPLGLSRPVAEEGVQGGAFRINTPSFSPPAIYNVGSAIEVVDQGVVMSNFVVASPDTFVDCQPILKFYVATGTYTPGTVMNFTQASLHAALCDFTGGKTEINVTLNNDGTWKVG